MASLISSTTCRRSDTATPSCASRTILASGSAYDEPGVECYALHKPPGKVPRFVCKGYWKLLRQLQPSIVHTRNLTTLAVQVPAMLAGAPGPHSRRAWPRHG